MSTWEDVANEVVPLTAPGGLATGPTRGREGRRGNLGAAFRVSRYLTCPEVELAATCDEAWGGEERRAGDGAYYHIDRDLLSFDEKAGDLTARLEAALAEPPSRWLDGLTTADLLFCDIETTGLSPASPLFLIGTMRFAGRQPRIHLYLARDPGEEKSVLQAFAAHVQGKTLVTFNGKSFDWPYIEGRASRWQVPLPKLAGHYDLLFSARSRWRSKLPNCKLQTLEMGICGRGRSGDIPSAHIPQRYHQWLQAFAESGSGAHLLSPVLFHNGLDVLTMAELICCMREEM